MDPFWFAVLLLFGGWLLSELFPPKEQYTNDTEYEEPKKRKTKPTREELIQIGYLTYKEWQDKSRDR